jgi:LysM repeat protein
MNEFKGWQRKHVQTCSKKNALTCFNRFSVSDANFNRWLISILFFLASLIVAGCRSSPQETATPNPFQTPTTTPEIGVTLATLSPPTQAVLLITPTPSPTLTPTPTATPIIYIIVEGDTLLALAIDNNTTTGEIENLNPGVQPNLLQIGQQIILPPPATPAFQSAAATLIPLQIEVINLNAYRTPAGSLWLVGEVINHSHLPAENVQLQIAIADAGGQGLAAITTWVTPGIVPAGSKAPFGALVSGLPEPAGSTLAAPSASIIGGQTLVNLGNRYLDLAVREPEATIEESQIELRGQIENTGTAAAAQILLVTTFYDVQGNVAGYHELLLADSLPPGTRHSFSFVAAPPGGRVSRYEFLIQALQV